MATMKDVGLTYARNAGANLSTALFKFCKVDTDGDIILSAAAPPVGVIIEAAVENKPVTVQYGGQCKVIVGAAPVAAGAVIAPDANSLAVTATSGAANSCGIALDAGAAGAIIEFAFTAG